MSIKNLDSDWMAQAGGSDAPDSSATRSGFRRAPDDPGVDGSAGDHNLYQTVNSTIQNNPALTVAACFVAGATLALVLIPRREPKSTARRLEREMSRYVSDLRKGARNEIRASGWSDTLDRVGNWASTDNAKAALQPWLDRAGEIVTQAREKVATTIQPR